MRKFRKKPVVIEAVRWQGRSLRDARLFCSQHGLPRFSIGSRGSKTGLIIQTLEGDHVAVCGDWIIKGVKGEFYPCKPDIFRATYDSVEEEEALPRKKA